MGEIKPRRPVVAFILSACPGLGQQYAGHIIRGVSAYIILIVVSWLSAIAYMFETSRFLSFLLICVPAFSMALIATDAMLCAKRSPKDYRLKWFNNVWIYAAVFVGLLFTINPLMDRTIGKSVVRAYFVTTKSMYPSVLKHDLIVINKLSKPKRGDIVLVSFDSDRKKGEGISSIITDQIIRRIVAQPGDRLELRGRNVYINNILQNEPYVSFADQHGYDPYSAKSYRLIIEKIPPKSFFVMSDARQYSFDSRVFGMVQENEISGIATKVFWSWNFDGNQFKWSRMGIYL